MNKFSFIKGEIRKITYELICKYDKPFIISTADVDILKKNKIIKNLDVHINDHTIDFIIDTSFFDSGFYKIMITVHINEEIIKNYVTMEIYD